MVFGYVISGGTSVCYIHLSISLLAIGAAAIYANLPTRYTLGLKRSQTWTLPFNFRKYCSNCSVPFQGSFVANWRRKGRWSWRNQSMACLTDSFLTSFLFRRKNCSTRVQCFWPLFVVPDACECISVELKGGLTQRHYNILGTVSTQSLYRFLTFLGSADVKPVISAQWRTSWTRRMSSLSALYMRRKESRSSSLICPALSILTRISNPYSSEVISMLL